MERATNPHRSPESFRGPSADQRLRSGSAFSKRSGTRTALHTILSVIVLLLVCALAWSRIDSDRELLVMTVLDVLVGVAIFALIMLNPRASTRWSRLILAIVVAVCCSAGLISWHHSIVRARKNAIFRQGQQQIEPIHPEDTTDTD